MEGMRGRVNTRPLGSVRPSLTIMDTVPKFPPLRPSETKLDKSYQGIAGNAMAVPPTKVGPEKTEPLVRPQLTFKVPQAFNAQRTVNSSKSDSNSCKSDDVAEKRHERELKDAMVREKQLKQQLMSLQKVIDDLKVQLQVKDKTITDLQAQFQRQEEYYKELYEKEQAAHQETKASLETTSRDLEAKVKVIEELKAQHEAQIAELTAKMEGELSALRAEKDKEIANRDKKINMLKQHMADTLKGNSWERQQQIDELTKELSRNQEEVETLRHKLKSLQKGAARPTADTSSASQLQQAQRTIQEKDCLIAELKALCARFEKQLKQQDVLLSSHTNNKHDKAYKPLK